MRYHLTSVGMAIIRKSTNNKFYIKKMHLFRVWRKGNPPTLWVQPLWRTVWRFLKKTKNRVTI